MKAFYLIIPFMVIGLCLVTGFTQEKDCSQTKLVAPDASVEKVVNGFIFTEGPARDSQGNIFFTDIRNNRIHKWTTDDKLVTFRENSGAANGLYFDDNDVLYVCEGGNRRVVSIDTKGNLTVIAKDYKGKKFNSPNDLWIDPKGGIYFSDPRYGRNRENMEMDGEHVYYITPDRENIIRVVDDMVRPNGLIGTPDGKKLYITDHGGNKTWVYKIQKDGTLSDKTLFASEGSDGMTIDKAGHVFLTTSGVSIYDSTGTHLCLLKVPERPTNVTFGGKNLKTLYITARTSLYSVRMTTAGY